MTHADTQAYSVLIVDDSLFMQRVIAEMISSDPAFTVTGFARNGIDAVQQVHTLQPDLVTLDLEMPKLDGLQALEQIMAESPRPVVVLSGAGSQFGDATIRALELGAVDFITKPSGTVSLDLPVIREALLEALRAASQVDVTHLKRIGIPRRGTMSGAPAYNEKGAARGERRPKRSGVPARRAVVIASSTGGPRALAEIVPALPRDLHAAVLIAQHMPKDFTYSLARHLDQASALAVSEGVDNQPLLEGQVYIAPGRTFMRVAGPPGATTIALEDAHSAFAACASADELFVSATQAFGANVVGVVLTGMGRDGATGARTVRATGGYLLVQDRETAVIDGMPKAAIASAGADRIVPLGDMAVAIGQAVTQQAETSA